MKLLLDQNISRKLVNKLARLYPKSNHVSLLGLSNASDEEIWKYARNNGFTLVTHDSDFNDLALLYGSPPKVIWVRTGNTSTKIVEKMLKENVHAIGIFFEDKVMRVLHLY